MSHNMSKDAFTEDTLYVLDHALSVIAREHDAVAGVLAHATPNTVASIELSASMTALTVAHGRLSRARTDCALDAAQSERTSIERAASTSTPTKKKAQRAPARASALETVGVPA